MCCGTETGSYLRLIYSCITQRKAQGPSETCNESKDEEEEEVMESRARDPLSIDLGPDLVCPLQGYLAHKKHPPRRTLQLPYA